MVLVTTSKYMISNSISSDGYTYHIYRRLLTQYDIITYIYVDQWSSYNDIYTPVLSSDTYRYERLQDERWTLVEWDNNIISLCCIL